MSSKPWESLPDSILLKQRICDLDLDLKSEFIQSCTKQLNQELKAKNLKFKPHFWISDDWFSPDGIPGIAVPFYLTHPRIAKLEKEQIGFCEGSTHNWCMKILRHEAGHAIDNAFKLRLKKTRQALFGKSLTDYPESYIPCPYSKKYVINLEDNYAQAHPDEDWAETFAVWLNPQSKWKTKYQNWPALEKLNYLNSIMKDIKKTSPKVQNQKTMTPLSTLTMTLEDYFKAKRKRLGIHKNKIIDKNINKLFTKEKRHTIYINEPAVNVIRQNRNEIRQKVAKQSNQYHYKVERLIKDLEADCLKGNLYFTSNPLASKKQLIKALSNKSIDYVTKGKDRIIM